MLEIDNITLTHGDKVILEPLSFNVARGKSLVIMGETGAGKSLIGQTIMGTLPPELRVNGHVFFDGQSIGNQKGKTRQLLWGRSLAMLPQEPWHALDPLMRSFNQVFESHRFVARLPESTARQQTRRDFTTLNLESAMTKRPHQLSGGMSQRVAFAAAVAGGGQVLIADEPTKGLDNQARNIIIDLLVGLAENGATVIVITHDIDVARRIGGDILVLKEGKLVEQGTTAGVLGEPRHHYTKALIAASPRNWPKRPDSIPGNTLLEAQQLVVGRENMAFNKAITISVKQGSRLSLSGPSGIGKTTLLDTLAGLIKPVSGQLVHKQVFTRTDIQKIYQDPPSAFAPHVSLMKSLADVAQLHQVAWPEVESLLRQLGIHTAILNRLPSAVSGGELQRIAIARALLPKPKLLLADEPTSRLDPITQQQAMQQLANISEANQIAIVLVTHDTDVAEKWADQSLFLT